MATNGTDPRLTDTILHESGSPARSLRRGVVAGEGVTLYISVQVGWDADDKVVGHCGLVDFLEAAGGTDQHHRSDGGPDRSRTAGGDHPRGADPHKRFKRPEG